MRRSIVLNLLLSFIFFNINAAASQSISPSPWLSHYTYPYPMHLYKTINQHKKVTMVYMDIHPKKSNGKIVVLLHGKNFMGAYWKHVIPVLTQKGYRVIVPDQVGFGKSSKPILYYTFQLLARNTHQLLQSLHLSKTIILGHSMGGMLAIRYALMYPKSVSKLILEDPLGLEDYRLYEPYTPVAVLYKNIVNKTPEQIKAYQKNYYVHWKPAYSPWANLQAQVPAASDAKKLAWISALTYEMIYTQPVVYELKYIKVPTLLIVGNQDRTAPGKATAPLDKQKLLGNFPLLAKKAEQVMPNVKVIVIKQAGHIPHLEKFHIFMKAVLRFLEK